MRGTSLRDVRTGTPGSAPSQSSVAAFGASTASRAERSVQSECRSNAATSSVARRGSRALFVPHTASTLSSVNVAAERASGVVLRSVRVTPTV